MSSLSCLPHTATLSEHLPTTEESGGTGASAETPQIHPLVDNNQTGKLLHFSLTVLKSVKLIFLKDTSTQNRLRLKFELLQNDGAAGFHLLLSPLLVLNFTLYLHTSTFFDVRMQLRQVRCGRHFTVSP